MGKKSNKQFNPTDLTSLNQSAYQSVSKLISQLVSKSVSQ